MAYCKLTAFQCTLKSLETFLIRNYFYNNVKKIKIRQINRTDYDLATGSLIEKY